MVEASARRLTLSPTDPEVMRRAEMIWSRLHGHALLIIACKTDVVTGDIEGWPFLMAISRAGLP